MPIRYEDAGLRETARYVIARPVEQVGAEYVRYESDYAAEPVYERNGHVYDSSHRAYQDTYGMGVPPSTQSHQY